MAWTNPRTWGAETLTSVLLNVHLRDNLNHLHDVFLGAQDLGANWLIQAGRSLSMSDPDVAHGMTSIVATDVYASFRPLSGTAGGLWLMGLSDSDALPLLLDGYVGSTTPTVAAVELRASKKNGTTNQALAATETIAAFSNAGSVRLRQTGDGTVYLTDPTAGENQALKPTYLGYSSTLRVVQIGANDTAGRSVAINVDPSGIAGGACTGRGQIFIPKNRSILSPDAAGTNWSGILKSTGSAVYVGPSLSSGECSGDVIVNASGLQVPVGLVVGYSATPTANRISLYDANFYLACASGGGYLQFDSNDWIYYSRTTNSMGFSVDAIESFVLSASGNISMFALAGTYGGGSRVLFVHNMTTLPTSNPLNGGLLYSESGAGKWRGSGGTTTTFGPAEPHCPICGRDFVLEWQNEKTGHLIVCLWCATEGFSRGVVKRELAA